MAVALDCMRTMLRLNAQRATLADKVPDAANVVPDAANVISGAILVAVAIGEFEAPLAITLAAIGFWIASLGVAFGAQP